MAGVDVHFFSSTQGPDEVPGPGPNPNLDAIPIPIPIPITGAGIAHGPNTRAGVDGARTSLASAGTWVESSWDLLTGLTVHEDPPDQAGLDEWLVVWFANGA